MRDSILFDELRKIDNLLISLKRLIEVFMNQGLLKSDFRLKKNLLKIRYFIGVAAGKGGVGKSSVAVHLALSLQKAGYSVGVLDADIYGPSLGKMMPLEKSLIQEEGQILPGEFLGVKVFSLAYVRSEGEAMIVRAPVANGLIMQSIEQVAWGDLDYLIVDFPPGTGDIQLTLMQMLPFSGAILVTTPQEVSCIDVEKAAQMFHQMQVPILGVIENMSYFEDSTGVRQYVFGKGGGEKIASYFGIPFLGQIPIDSELSRSGDLGLALPYNSPACKSLESMAMQIKDFLFDLEEEGEGCLKTFTYEWKEMD